MRADAQSRSIVDRRRGGLAGLYKAYLRFQLRALCLELGDHGLNLRLGEAVRAVVLRDNLPQLQLLPQSRRAAPQDECEGEQTDDARAHAA